MENTQTLRQETPRTTHTKQHDTIIPTKTESHDTEREEEEQSKHGAGTTTQDWTVSLFLAKADRQVKTAHS